MLKTTLSQIQKNNILSRRNFHVNFNQFFGKNKKDRNYNDAKEQREIRRAVLEERKNAREKRKLKLEIKKDKREERFFWFGSQGIFVYIGVFYSIGTYLYEQRKENIKKNKEKDKLLQINYGLIHHTQLINHQDGEAKQNNISQTLETLQSFDIDFQDYYGYTALHHAARRGDSTIVAALLSRGAKPIVVDKNNETPLYKAIFNNYPYVVDQLLSVIPPVNLEEMVNKASNQGVTPLMAAIYTGNYSLFEKLLNLGAKIENENLHKTALHLAIRYKREGIAIKLISTVIDNDKQEFFKHSQYHSALHLSKGSYKEWINKPDSDGFTPLGLAIKYGLNKVVEKLLEKGADINAMQGKKGEEKRPILGFILCNNNHNIFDIIIERDDLIIDQKTNTGRTPYDSIVSVTNGKSKNTFSSYYKMKDKLYQKLECTRNRNKNLAFQAASSKKASLQPITDYLQCGGNLDDKDESDNSILDYFIASDNLLRLDDHGNNILHLAARFNDLILFKKLLSQNEIIKLIDQKNSRLTTPLFEAAYFGSHKLIELLVEHGADIEIKTKLGWTVLSAATWSGHISVVKELLSLYRKSIAHFSIEDRKKKLYNFINSQTTKGETALWWAINIIDTLPSESTFWNNYSNAIESKTHPFYQDIKEIIKELLKHEADINIPDVNGITPLHIMASNGLDDIAQMVLENNNVLLEIPAGEYQERALHFAAEYGHIGMIKLLIKYKVDITSTNIGGRTAYDLTNIQEIKDILEAEGYNRNKVLHRAPYNSSFEENNKELFSNSKTDFKHNICGLFSNYCSSAQHEKAIRGEQTVTVKPSNSR